MHGKDFEDNESFRFSLLGGIVIWASVTHELLDKIKWEFGYIFLKDDF